MELTQEQLEQFDREGYLFLPNLFSPEEAAFLKTEAETIYGMDRKEVWREQSGVARTARSSVVTLTLASCVGSRPQPAAPCGWLVVGTALVAPRLAPWPIRCNVPPGSWLSAALIACHCRGRVECTCACRWRAAADAAAAAACTLLVTLRTAKFHGAALMESTLYRAASSRRKYRRRIFAFGPLSPLVGIGGPRS